ncbi:MAG: AbrB/MazE/SpoVT family DNA-binding domain-containing protein [Chloroflexota bacterium]|nr:AbrB/MazE/SpoVT family DNA-binding domain-containing protein [Chloroflexota bacterium]
MASQTTKMTRKGQVTIPVDIRNALDLHEGDHFIVHQDDHRVVLERASDAFRRTAGVFAKYALPTPPTPEEEQEAVELAVAEDYLASLVNE